MCLLHRDVEFDLSGKSTGNCKLNLITLLFALYRFIDNKLLKATFLLRG